MKLELRKFDPSKITSDSVVVMSGRRGSGKSSALRDLLSHHRGIPIGCAISPTEVANKSFGNFIPSMLIHDEYSPELLQKFMDRQTKIITKLNDEKTKSGFSNIDPRAFMILDDCMYDSKAWVNDKNIRSLFFNGRHYKIFFILTTQYPLGLPPAFRCNVDYTFIFKETILKNQQRIYEQYAGMFPSFDAFRQVLTEVCQDYACLVIDNKTQSSNLQDQIFWYKADINKNFKMCDPSLWSLQALNDERKMKQNRTDEDDEEDFDPNVINKSKLKINVKKRN
tara:strand:- start:2021 stop:2863 length:843 start_codon:yes stop_codon:yes gene_type:complete